MAYMAFCKFTLQTFCKGPPQPPAERPGEATAPEICGVGGVARNHQNVHSKGHIDGN